MLTGSTPRTRATRARILEGAARAVAGRGLRATTVQDILGEASVSRRTFYQYFGNLEQALDALYELATDELIAAVHKSADPDIPPRARIAAGVRAYLDVQRSGGALLFALQAEAIRPDSLLAPRRERTLDALVAQVEEAVYEALEARMDPYVWRGLLIGIEGLVLFTQRGGRFTDEDRERLESVMTGMFLALLVSRELLPPG